MGEIDGCIPVPVTVEILSTIEQLKRELAKPTVPPGDGMFDHDDHFVPWRLFPSVYGHYSAAFDEMALAVLADIQAGTFNRRDLASEMFREMLCKADLCEYGTSPRVCFPTEEFKAVLPELIERWAQYVYATWEA